MSRSKKLELDIGAKFEDGWSQVEDKESCNSKILQPHEHALVFTKEKRRGKINTIIKEFYLPRDQLKALLGDLKSSLACGGAIKGNSIELQGDVVQKLKELLKTKGFRLKKG